MYRDFLVGDAMRFQKYGVRILIRAERKSDLKKCYEALMKNFPHGLEFSEETAVAHSFVIKSDAAGTPEFYLNAQMLFKNADREFFFEMASSRIRLTIAEFAVRKVFLHAGTVGWKGRAIIIPATSFSGKTTLVAELVKKGAVYYSDEYAVLDEDGNVEPFPKWLSMRGIINDWEQLDRPVESIGGVAGETALPVALILISKYKKGRKNASKMKPRKLTPGQGIMELLPHTLPIRNNPRFVLDVLNKLINRAIIVRTLRGEAADFAGSLLDYFELHITNH